MGKKWLARGVPARTRTENYHRKGLWAMKKRGPTAKTIRKKPKDRSGKRKVRVLEKPFGKGTRRVVRPRAPRSYPTEKPLGRLYRRSQKYTPKLRKSLVPGTILIILSGRNRGRRVILLKGLRSGLLLVTGPFLVNGVPLRRVSPHLVIATSTRLDLTGVNIPDEITDRFFTKRMWMKKHKKVKRGKKDFLETDKEKEKKPEEDKLEKKLAKLLQKKIKMQKKVDKQIMPLVKKIKHLQGYLAKRFTLQFGDQPHNIKF